MSKDIIRAANCLPKPSDPGDGQDFGLPASDHLLINLFGDAPDYNHQKYEAIWREVFDAAPPDMIAYCLEQGVDVTGDDGKPVDGWRDIAVMLKAIERGIAKLSQKENEENA